MKFARLAMLVVVCSAALVSAQTPAQAASASSTEQELTANEHALITAKQKDDAAYFKKTLAPNFSFVTIDGSFIDGPEAAGGLGDTGIVELTPYNMKVIVSSPDLAIVNYDAVLRMAPEEDQGPPPRYQHFSSVWVRQGGEWKLQFHQTTAQHFGDW